MRIRLLLASLAVFYFCSLVYTERSRAVFDGSDSWGYYAHLPASLMYHDVGDYAQTIAAWQLHYPNKADPRKDAYGMRPTPSGKTALKYPYGMALLETPFFAAAHVYCLASGWYPADGFSAPYAWLIALSSAFYALLGLFFLFKSLRYYFSERISLGGTALIGLGTNLFFFVAYTPGMSHPVAFCLVAFLILATIRWYRQPSRPQALAIGIALGLIAVVRTQDLIVGLIPLLWGVRGWRDLSTRAHFLANKKLDVVWAMCMFALALAPQSLYWKFVSGQWWRYGYQGEQFNWAHPALWKGLFGFQNGWLVYTPLMILAIFGLFRLRRFVPDMLLPLLLLLPLHWYISYAWWCWMYINGFGSRPMVDLYAALAFPLCAWVASQNRAWVLYPVLGGLMALNLFQTWQTNRGIFWSERGSWAFYKESFGQTSGTEQMLSAFESREVQPGVAPLKIRDLALLPVDTNDPKNMEAAGHWAHPCVGEFHQTLTIHNDTAKLVPGQWLRVSVAGFVPSDTPQRALDDLASFVVDLSTAEGKVLKYSAIKIGTHLGNPRYILWKTRGTGEWGEASLFVKIPPGFDAGSRATAYVWNPSGQNIYVGELKVSLFQAD